MSYALETKRVGRFTVTLEADDTFNTWEDVLCDEPVLVFTRDRHGTRVQFDGTKTVQESMLDVLRVADESGCTDALDEMDAEWRWTDAGTLRVDSSSLKSVRYFKDAASAVRSIFRADYGKELADFQVERFDTRDETYFCVWFQPELDKYAGIKNAKFCRETIRAYLDGEVYGWTVQDADGDALEACYGYIGDARDVLAEAESVARGLEADALKADAEVLEASRLDLYADA